MKTIKFLAIVISVCFCYANSYSQTSYSFNDGLNAAKTSGKKILVSVYTDSDNWSKKMKSEVFSSAKVQSGLSDFVFIPLNAEGSESFTYNKKQYSPSDLSKFFGATGYPTFVIMNSDGSIIRFKYNGEEVGYISGFIGENDFIEMLNFFSAGKYKDSDLSTVFQN